MTHKVRVRQNPGQVIEVDDAEYADLERQGLLVGNDGKANDKATAKPVPNKEG